MPIFPALTTPQLLVGVAALFIAALTGLFIGYLVWARTLKTKTEQLKQLERRERDNHNEHQVERDALDHAHQAYRGEVRNHFDHTSQLMSKMVDNYRQMYQHLATGAQQLADMHEIKQGVAAPPPEAITAAGEGVAVFEDGDSAARESASSPKLGDGQPSDEPAADKQIQNDRSIRL